MKDLVIIPKLWRGRERLRGLLKRAAMSIFSYNTGVIRSIDDSFRVAISRAFEPRWGDCVSLSVHFEKNNPERVWHVSHISPARARILALHLLRLADYIENPKNNMGYDGRCIDEPSDSMAENHR